MYKNRHRENKITEALYTPTVTAAKEMFALYFESSKSFRCFQDTPNKRDEEKFLCRVAVLP